jgi:hypothetical protein
MFPQHLYLMESRTNYSQNRQHYPPGTQENDNSFSLRNLFIGKGKELEFPQGRGGGKGEPGVPPKNRGNPRFHTVIKAHYHRVFHPFYPSKYVSYKNK